MMLLKIAAIVGAAGVSLLLAYEAFRSNHWLLGRNWILTILCSIGTVAFGFLAAGLWVIFFGGAL